MPCLYIQVLRQALFSAIFLYSWMPPVPGQGLSPTAFVNAGSAYTDPGNGLMVEWVIGQMTFTTLTGGNNSLTPGVLQPMFSAALPVELLEFLAIRQSPSLVELHWTTSAEINNAGFFIEKRPDTATDFSRAGFVSAKSAAGYSNAPLVYHFTDQNASSATTYYRLAQTDLDGKLHYSPVRAVPGGVAAFVVTQWPNPAQGSFFVRIDHADSASAVLTDPAGRLIRQVDLTGGQATALEVITPGIYLLRVTSGTEYRVLRVVVTR